MLFSRGFFSLFVTQFFGAFNDNLYKNALVIYITYILAIKQGFSPGIFVTLSAGVFIFPFFIFSASAGIIADNTEKSKLIQWVKLAEIFIMSLALVGFYLENMIVLLTVLFLMGIQSTFFGPLKYSLLPFFLKDDELIKGNGLINSATFIAILLGTIGGSYFILEEYGVIITGSGIIVFAIFGWLSSTFIPKVPAFKPLNLTKALNVFTQTRAVYLLGTKDQRVKQTLYGVSWFWFIGASIVSQLPTMVSIDMNADNTVYILFLALFAVGIGFGAFLCGKFIKYPTVRYAPAMLFTLAGLMILCYVSFLVIPEIDKTNGKMGLLTFLGIYQAYPLMVVFFLTAVAGGVYIIPQFALTQQLSHPEERSQVIAANNILNALFMVLSAIFIVGFNVLEISVPIIFASIGILNIPFYFYWKRLVN